MNIDGRNVNIYYDDGPDRRALLDHSYRFGQVDYRQHQRIGMALKLAALHMPLITFAKRFIAAFTTPEFLARMNQIRYRFDALRTVIGTSPKQKAREQSRRDVQAKRRAARRNDLHKPGGR